MEKTISFADLTAKYLQWCKVNRAERSLEWYEGHLEKFLLHLGDSASIDALSLRPYHIAEWIDSKTTWGNTYKGGAIVAVKRVFNWAEKMGYIDINPVKKIEKPHAERRNNPMMPEDYERNLAALDPKDPFHDAFVFVWNTACRPQEFRHIEPRHVTLEYKRIKFPALESKGKRHPRRILLNSHALEIVERRMRKHSDGKLFINTRGDAWTKFAICNRMDRLTESTGKRFSMYDMRHGRITQMLKDGMDVVTAAAIAGHRNGTMIATVYSHVDDDEEYLLKMLG